MLLFPLETEHEIIPHPELFGYMATLIIRLVIENIGLLLNEFLFWLLCSYELGRACTLVVEDPSCTFGGRDKGVAALVAGLPRLHIAVIIFGHSDI